MALDSAAAGDVMATTMCRAQRAFADACGERVHVALFIGDEGGSRFAHTFETESEMKEWLTDVLAHCGSVQ